MLNPLLRCGRHIDEIAARRAGRRPSRAARRAEAVRRLAEVGITDPDVVDRYPFQLSGGMRQRVAIAAALARDPELLIADEPSTALDVTTQQRDPRAAAALQERRGMGLVLITHDLRVAFAMCDRDLRPLRRLAARGRAGRGAGARCRCTPTRSALLLSEPPIDRRVARARPISGRRPAPDEVADRCAFRRDANGRSRVLHAGARRRSWTSRRTGCRACVRIDEIRGEMRGRRPRRATARCAMSRRRAEPASRAGRPRSQRRRKSFGPVERACGRDARGRREARASASSASRDPGRRPSRAVCSASRRRRPGDRDRRDRRDRLRRADRRRTAGGSARKVQIVFQDPYSSLNPALSIGSTLKEALAGRRATRERRRPSCSSGSACRARTRGASRPRCPAASASASRSPARSRSSRSVLVCDEPVSALDVSVQAQILNLLRHAAPRARARVPLHHARPRGRAPGGRPRLRALSRRGRRERRSRRRTGATSSPVHNPSDRVGPSGRSGGAAVCPRGSPDRGGSMMLKKAAALMLAIAGLAQPPSRRQSRRRANKARRSTR